VLVAIDVFTRRIIGFGIERASIDGMSVCRMFNHAVAGRPPPRRVSIRLQQEALRHRPGQGAPCSSRTSGCWIAQA
jgi:transposase InsO family protein